MSAVKNIERITKTMQMIATAKFTNALMRAKATQPYTEKIRQLVTEVTAAAGDLDSPLVDGPTKPVKRELLLVLGSNRGLCGAYNGNVLRAALKHVRRVKRQQSEVVLETSGKKPVGFFKFQNVTVAEQHQFGDDPGYDDVRRLAESYIDRFADGEFDAIRVASMQFISNSRQRPRIMQLLPLKAEADEQATETPEAGAGSASYDFSPSAEALLDELLPTTVKTSLFQAFNEAVVSEQIMRMIAMKAATENAKDLSKSLRRQFNRARQAQITTELMEVISGAAALD